jgi:PKD repeat protein/sugar lactone lactonase YvrE
MSHRSPHTRSRRRAPGIVFLHLASLLLTVAILLPCSPVSSAEEVTELWRGGDLGLTDARLVAASPFDGSCWVVTKDAWQLMEIVQQLDANGRATDLSFIGGRAVGGIAIDPNDGSCWIAEGGSLGRALYHYGLDGSLLLRVGLPRAGTSIALNPSDGSVWVTLVGGDPKTGTGNTVVHLAANGNTLWTSTTIYGATSVAVDPTDGSCWVADTPTNRVLHLASDGTILSGSLGLNAPRSVSVDAGDHCCWIADTGNNRVVRVAQDGSRQFEAYGFNEPQSVSAGADHTCWVADTGNNQVVRLAANGDELWRGSNYITPTCVALNPADGGCFVANTGGHRIVRVGADNEEVWRVGCADKLWTPWAVSVDPTDGSCWVADLQGLGLRNAMHFAENGEQLWYGGGFSMCYSVAVNPTDGSCWVTGCPKVIHVAADGSILFSREDINYGRSVSVNPVDGSCWVAVCVASVPGIGGSVLHLAADGTELLAVGELLGPTAVAVNPTDGSCWVVDCSAYTAAASVIHLAADGTQLSVTPGFVSPECLSVSPVDGTCWVADGVDDQVVHLDTNGTVLASFGGLYGPSAISVGSDGTCWVADTGNDQIVHLATDGTELSRTGGFNSPQGIAVNAYDDTLWVADTGNVQIVHLAVAPSNRPPVAVDDTATIDEDTPAGIAVLANDSDPDGDPLTITEITQPSHGTATINGVSVDYAPAQDYNGSDSFAYTVSDEAGETATATVSITVTAVNDLPVAAFTFSPEVPTTEEVVAFTDGSTDVDGTIASWAWDFGDGGGAATANPTHQYAEKGTYTVTLTVTDDAGDSRSASLDVAVPGNTPVGSDVTIAAGPGVSITFSAITAPGDTSVTVSDTPPHGPKTGFCFMGTYWDIVTDATYTAPLTISIAYDPADVPGNRESHLKIFHWNGTGWEDATISIDTVNHIITAQVSSLSWFAIGWPTYQWLGFLPPISDADRPFKQGSTIPIKFRVADSDGTVLTAAVATLATAYLTAGAPAGVPEVVSTAAGDAGNQFRYSADDDLYIFNLSTKSATYYAPYTYQATVTLDDGTTHSVEFSLK